MTPWFDGGIDRVMYFSGKHSLTVQTTAKRRGDIGLVVTPQNPQFTDHAAHYPAAIVDNGAFTKDGFNATDFRRLLERVIENPSVKTKVWFVVAPDVVGDAARTLEQFDYWEPEIHALGLPVAFVAQNGLEDRLDQIPWRRMDALFVGGCTAWKEGDFDQELWAEENQLPPRGVEEHPRYSRWLRIWETAKAYGMPIHMGRVNSLRRLELATVFNYEAAQSVDGTMLVYHERDRLAELEGWLDWVNHGTGRLVDGDLRECPLFEKEERYTLWNE